MKKIFVAGLLLLVSRCSSPVAQPGPGGVGGPLPPYKSGMLPLDPATMMYQQNNVSQPPTDLFQPRIPKPAANFNPGYGLLLAEHTIIIDLPPQWEAKNLTLHLLDGPGEFEEGQRYYAVARGGGGLEKLVYTFTGSRYNEEVTVALPRETVYERLVLRGPAQAQPARLSISGDYRPYPPPRPSARPRAPLAAYTGTNVFPWNLNRPDGHAPSEPRFAAVTQAYGGLLRVYLELEKLVPVAGQHQFKYWNLDELARQAHERGPGLLLTIVHSTRAELETWPQGNYQGRPTLDMDAPPRAHDADPLREASYQATGEAGYQLAARYGANANIPDANLKCYTVPEYPGAPVAGPRKGLGYVRYYETHNELDKDWKGRDHYMDGWQMGIYQSVLYDGAQGRLGPTCGIKTADPTAVVLNPGLAKATPDAFRGMIDCWKKTRGYRPDGSLDIPLDQWNYHHYSTNGGVAQHTGAQTRGVAPETVDMRATARRMADFAAHYGGGKPVVLTETGYDVQPKSPLAALREADLQAYPNREQVPAARVQLTQAVWSLRLLLEVAAGGVDGIAWYQAYDDNGSVPYIYQSSGQLNNDNSRRPVTDFLVQARALMGQYSFRERLSENPRVDIWQAGARGPRLAVLWLPVEDDRRSTYSLPPSLRPAAAGTYYVPTVGAATMSARPLFGPAGGRRQVPLSERPVFVPLAAAP
ncbi:hypothetical protein [uncultured Hymenobacter sp.]|uniref:hypothetical protein n=1 Tax=uncultured Hymenobacter sp. TaxID=170016 RepID=UPI0035CB1E07